MVDSRCGNELQLQQKCSLVMCWLRLGLKALVLAWLEVARAWQNHKPGQKPKVGLGLAWLWPRLGPVSL